MITRETILKVSQSLEKPVAILPENWDASLVGYECRKGVVVAAYDYDLAFLTSKQADVQDFEDLFLDDIREARSRVGQEPIILHTRSE